MFRNYLKIALRNLTRQKSFSAINIAGLGVGMACSVLIFLWVCNELSYNRFNEKADRVFRLVQTQHYVSGPLTTTCMPGVIARDIMNDVPEISRAFMYYVEPAIVNYNDKFFREEIRLADSALWEMFTFNFIQGNPDDAFDQVNSIVITETLAGKYFGEENPMGKVLRINDEQSYLVTGVIREIPKNSTFRFDLCIPFENIRKFGHSYFDYGWNSYFCYVELRPGTDYRELNGKIKDFLMIKSRDPSQGSDDSSEFRVDLFLFPLKDIYLHSVSGKGGNITNVILFSVIALFILVIACINFMNLSTARAARRSREIGLRKVAGASRDQLIIQFISESLLITMLSFLLSILLVYLFLPGFNELAGKSLEIDWSDPVFAAGLAGIILFVGILSGSYPAFYMSSLQPVVTLKNLPLRGRGGLNFRRILVVFQFTLSVAMIICTLVVYRQLDYVGRKDLGLERKNVIFTEMRGKSRASYEELKQSFLQDPSVLSVTRASHLPFDIGSNSGGFTWEGKEIADDILIGTTASDVDYIRTVGLKMVAGRFFEPGYATDTSSAVVINETAARVMGMDEPVGKWVENGGQRFSIIGVVGDFHFLPVTMEISPLFFFNSPSNCNIILVKISGDDAEKTFAHLQQVWDKTNPGFPFEYDLMDAAYDELYSSESRLGSIFRYFSILTILISGLGLFGLAAFMAEQRTKEIGIRKVLGADVRKILALLSGNFLKWVFVANLLAWPVAWFVMDRWLDGYKYHTPLSPWIFLLAAGLSLLIALVTVFFQTMRAASRNPLDALKYE